MEDIFIQTEEHRAILETVKNIVDDSILPWATEVDA